MTTILSWGDGCSSDYWHGFKCLSCKKVFQFDSLSRIYRKQVKEQDIADSYPKFCPCCGERVEETKELPESASRIPEGMRGNRRDLPPCIYVVKSRVVNNEFSDFTVHNFWGRHPDHDDPLFVLKTAQMCWNGAVDEIKETYPMDMEIVLIRYNRDSIDTCKPGIGDGKVIRRKIIEASRD